ncbi:hypothetical protein [Fibrella arboris]|uniref:hypothetical protein n=1 Tax=Fibrella arboris TaxID=3242486 RepID=UPI003520AF3A
MTYLLRQSVRVAVAGLCWVLTLLATDALAQTTVVLPRSCKSCPLSTHGTGDITSFDNCSVASTGTLTSGTPASAVTQTIAVTVGKLGTYNLQAIANGVIFSASGSFTATGSQQVVLTGTGTPLAVGTYTYTLNTTPTCSFQRITLAGAASAKGAIAPCPGAFVNVMSFGMQRTVGTLDGFAYDDQSLGYDNMFLSADGSTLYDTRGYYHDVNNLPAIIANKGNSGAKGMDAVVPVQAIRQVFPGVTFKQFSHVDLGTTAAGRYVFLLTSTNDLYGMVLLMPPPNQYYLPMMGPTLAGTTTPASGTAYNAGHYQTVKLTTPTMKFSSFWHGFIGAMFAYNPADNLVYSWGNNFESPPGTRGSNNTLFRTPSSDLDSYTPGPATVINTILTRNNTSLKEMTDSDVTFLVGASSTVEYNQPQANAVFIGKDGKVYRYFYINQKNYKISLPGSAKAVSVMSTVNQYGTKLIVILGDDGKLYTDNLLPSLYVDATSSAPYLPTTNDQAITATQFNSSTVVTGGPNSTTGVTAVDNLTIVQILSPWNTGSQYAQSIGALANDGTLYRIFDNTPRTELTSKGVPIVPLSTANINITLRDGLPLFSKIFTVEERTQINQQFVGRSKTTGNTVAAATNGQNQANLNATASLSQNNGFIGHFSDTGTFINSTTIMQYVWFNCYDPWSN